MKRSLLGAVVALALVLGTAAGTRWRAVWVLTGC